MNEENFLVQFIPTKHCFLQFSNKWFQKINTPKYSCVRLVHPVTKEELRFTWAPQPSFGLNDCSVGINATFAQGLNLHENELLVISTEENVTSLRQVFLTPVTAEDYEILEMSRDNVEVSLLDQIRVVFVKQVVCVWVSKTVHLKLTVDRLDSDALYGRLEQLTELVIENVSKAVGIKTQYSNSTINKATNVSSPPMQDESYLWNLFSHYVPNKVLDLLKSNESSSHLKTEQIAQSLDNSHLICRIHPPPSFEEPLKCCDGVHNELIHPFNVFVHKRTLERVNDWPKDTFIQTLLEGKSLVALCRLEGIPKRKPASDKKLDDKKVIQNVDDYKDIVSVFVRLFLIEDSCAFSRTRTNVSCVYVSSFLRKVLDLRVGSKLKLTGYFPPPNIVLLGISLVPASKLSKDEADAICKQFAERLPSRDGVLVNNYCPLPLPLPDGSVSTVMVLLSPPDLNCWPITAPELQVCPITVAEVEEKGLESLQGSAQNADKTCMKTSVFNQLVGEGVTTLEFGLKLIEDLNQHNMVSDNILITGKRGSGKSRLAEAISSSLSGPPHHVHVCVVDCKPLKGKKPELVGKVLSEQLEECVYHQPSLLVLDDLPCIAGAPTNNLEPSQEASYFLRLATVVKELLWKVTDSQGVSVIATAENKTQIQPQLLSARGRHTFSTLFHIPTLLKADRQQILCELMLPRLLPGEEASLEALAGRTEGCVAQDLVRLADRALFKACQRLTQAAATEGEGVRVSAVDLEAAVQGFVPMDLVNVSLTRHRDCDFSSIGGLWNAKELLTQVLIWPTKYSEVFSQCPLRLERGVLLYGAPGTGKTLLAHATASESGLNFITVKGPELLSKYIGASEEAVRNVFQKAQSAQPCILFFDEFDSLAPRRGHDSTGVTDRVVNQLLTQMDGVEALEGVWVLAAASRPDLLDPALLRPGRIGTLIPCPLPDQAERLAILESLSSKLQLSDNVDLAVIAAQTDGYTGADLQAILFTAQMTAYDNIHKVEETNEELVEPTAPVIDVVVNQVDLLIALRDTMPSLKPEDRFRFQQIYERFQKNKGGAAQWPANEAAQRVTLA